MNMTDEEWDEITRGRTEQILTHRTGEFMEYKDKELEDVRSFHNKFDLMDAGRTPTMVTKRKLQERIECLQEELDEFKLAVEKQDFSEQADALIDLVYFAKGTAVMMGLPWEDLWDDVQRANISKVRGVGKRGHAVDMIKPEGWQKPIGDVILARHGFDQVRFEDSNGIVDESKCYDEQHERQVHYIDIGTLTPAEAHAAIEAAMANAKNGGFVC